jgi:hypothetical protein
MTSWPATLFSGTAGFHPSVQRAEGIGDLGRREALCIQVRHQVILRNALLGIAREESFHLADPAEPRLELCFEFGGFASRSCSDKTSSVSPINGLISRHMAAVSSGEWMADMAYASCSRWARRPSERAILAAVYLVAVAFSRVTDNATCAICVGLRNICSVSVLGGV